MDSGHKDILFLALTLLVLIQNVPEIVGEESLGCQFDNLETYLPSDRSASFKNAIYGNITGREFVIELRSDRFLRNLIEVVGTSTGEVMAEYLVNNMDVIIAFYNKYLAKTEECHVNLEIFEYIFNTFTADYVPGAVSYSQAVEVLKKIKLAWVNMYITLGAIEQTGFVASVWADISYEDMRLVTGGGAHPKYFFNNDAAVVVKLHYSRSVGYIITYPNKDIWSPVLLLNNEIDSVNTYNPENGLYRRISYQTLVTDEYVAVYDLDVGRHHLIKMKPLCSFTRTTANLELFNPLRTIAKRNQFGMMLASITVRISRGAFKMHMAMFDPNYPLIYETDTLDSLDDLIENRRFTAFADVFQMTLLDLYTKLETLYQMAHNTVFMGLLDQTLTQYNNYRYSFFDD